MAKPMDVENLRPLFKKVLQTHQLEPKELRRNNCVIHISDKGEFLCEKCQHIWHSMFSWITFNLQDLEITYRWKMKCKHCFQACIPKFTVTQLESMFEKAVKLYKGEKLNDGVNTGYRVRRVFRQPHIPELCEKCGWGYEHCWWRSLNCAY